MKRGLCVVRDCDHRDEPGWVHVAPRREVPVTAHLRRYELPEGDEAA